MDRPEFNDRLTKLNKLKSFLNEVDEELSFLKKFFNWDSDKLVTEEPSAMVNCSFDPRHRVPRAKITVHEEKCRWRGEGWEEGENPFPEHSGQGSFVTLNSKLIHEITSGISPLPVGSKPRGVPNSTANLDQNFSREEKLAIYDYVISNTQKPNAFSDLHLQASEKTEERRELSAWEIAMAERDAKRRRASYRNKVHTNRKSYTEVMREVIEGQMEILKDESSSKTKVSMSKCEGEKSSEKHNEKRYKDVSRHGREETRYSSRDSWRRNNKDDLKERKRSREHSGHKNELKHGRNRQNDGIDSNSRSRSIDNHKRWKSREEKYFHSSKSNRD